MADRHMAARHYDLNGVTLAVTADRPEAAGFLDFVLSPLAIDPTEKPDCRIAIETRGTLPPAARGVLQFEGALPESLPAQLVRDGDLRTLDAPGHYQAESLRGSDLARVLVAPGSDRWLTGTLAFWLLDELLVGKGRIFLHAACLARPAGDAILVFAASGTGKTTTALALARNGYGLMGDDVALLEFRDGRPWVWGLPRPINLHRRTAAMLSWIDPILRPWRGEEQSVPFDKLATCIDRAAAKARPCGAMVMLQPPNPEGHRAAPMARTEAMVQAAADNLRVAPGGLDEDGELAFDALARLIAAVPVLQLEVGPDPDSLRPDILEGAGVTAR